jgi:hypothetical protein
MVIELVTHRGRIAREPFGAIRLTGDGPKKWNNINELQERLICEGFEHSVEYDKNWHNDTFDTLKFDTYTLNLPGEVKIEVCNAYIAEKPNEFNYSSTCCLLIIESTSFEMPGASINNVIALSRQLVKCFNKPISKSETIVTKNLKEE